MQNNAVNDMVEEEIMSTSMKKSKRYLFGPVNTRRLGISLGIDLLPYKTCSLDCVYCECGETTNLTIERKDYVPTEKVIEELDLYLSENPKLDYVTFSGSGEPTLHSEVGKVINFIKDQYPQYHVAMLTNSTLLHDKKVREDIARLDLIIPSLDAVSNEVYEKILRPHPEITTAEIIVEGLKKLSDEFTGKIVLEIFLVPDINDTPEELRRLKQVATEMNPELIQLNNLDRPGVVDWVTSLSDERFQ